MIKTLQKKFIFTAMTAVSVLLIVLIGTMNIANGLITVRQMNIRIQMLVDNELEMQQPGLEETDKPDKNSQQPPMPDRGFRQRQSDFEPKSFWNPPIDEDTAMSLRFFVVQFDENGEIVHTDVSRISSVAESEAQTYAKEAAEGTKQSGYIQDFKYLSVSVEDGGKIVLFLDISSQLHSMLLVCILSVSIAAACWIGMLLLVILLSRKAILPIAQNMEKQKQFVTDAGHEIKTPLAIILTNIDAMELINGENKWSKNIRVQTNRLNGLMQNLLTLAKMDEAGMEIPMTDFIFSGLVEEALKPFFETAAWRGIVIETDIQPDVLIHANQEYIQRLLSILFDNAVKYANENGIIHVSLRKSEKSVVLQVKNTCEQLPEGKADKLFDRFYRGDGARTQKSGGYGIGLSAARAIVEAQKGTISAKYEGKNTIVFIVRF